MKPLERVQKLIALAGSSNENEARNAATEACRLIREHKLTVSDGAPPAPSAPPPPHPSTNFWDWFGVSPPVPPPPSATPRAKPKPKKGVARVVVDVVQEANARAAVERRRPDLKRLAHDYSGAATRKLAEIAEELGLKTEAAVLRRAAEG